LHLTALLLPRAASRPRAACEAPRGPTMPQPVPLPSLPDGRRLRPASRLGSREHGHRSRPLNYSVPPLRSPSQAPRECGQLAQPRGARHKKWQSHRRLRYRGYYGVGFYNPRRRHSSLDYLSPIDYEQRHYAMIVVADDPQPAAVLTAVKDASRRLRRSPAAILDRRCARLAHRRAGMVAEPDNIPK
jgi:transposase InsO family protein